MQHVQPMALNGQSSPGSMPVSLPTQVRHPALCCGSPSPSLPLPSLPLSLSFPLSRFVALSLSGRPVMFVWCGAVSWHWGGKRACATPAGQPPPAAAAATCATPSWNGQPLLGSSASGTVAAPAQGNHRHARDTLAFLDRAPHCCCVCFWLCVCVFSPHTVCTRSGGVPTSRVQLTPPPNPTQPTDQMISTRGALLCVPVAVLQGPPSPSSAPAPLLLLAPRL